MSALGCRAARDSETRALGKAPDRRVDIRQRERERQRDRQTDRQRGRQTERQTDGRTDRQTDRRVDRQTDREAGRQIDREAERQANMQVQYVARQTHPGNRTGSCGRPVPQQGAVQVALLGGGSVVSAPQCETVR